MSAKSECMFHKPNREGKRHSIEFSVGEALLIVDNFHGDVVWKKTRAFPCFVIYHNPIDFPGKYCVRLFDGNNPTRSLAVKDTLEDARKAVPPFFGKVPRSETDPPTIVETWL